MRQGYCRPAVRELCSGIDALYLSGRASLPDGLLGRLEQARTAAESARQAVSLLMGGYEFELQPFALGKYRYRLDHPLAVVGVTPSETFPAFRVQTRAEALHSSTGPDGVARWAASIADNEDLATVWTVSRLDLHADVQGWQLTGNERHRFVCRARSLGTYEEDFELEGLTFGKRKTGSINCRIYDKTRELAGNGHDWWYELWGPAYDRAQPVTRVEFEFHRAALREMGLQSPEQTLGATDRLWAYATREWLTYRRPSAHERSARWPLAPEWERIQRVSLAGNALPVDRITAGRTQGALRTLMPLLNGCVAAFGSWIGATDIDAACAALPLHLKNYERVSGRAFTDRVSEKLRKRQ